MAFTERQRSLTVTMKMYGTAPTSDKLIFMEETDKVALWVLILTTVNASIDNRPVVLRHNYIRSICFFVVFGSFVRRFGERDHRVECVPLL